MIDFNDTPIISNTYTQPPVDPLQLFRNQLVDNGIPVSGTILADGQIHREGAKGKYYYSLHQGKNAFFGIMGDWSRHSRPVSFSSVNLKELSGEDIKEHEAILAANRKTLKIEKLKKQAIAARLAKKMWEQSEDAAEHEYLTAKNVKAHGLKISSDGELLIPMRDDKGKLCCLQKIAKEKKFLFGGKVEGCSCTIAGDGTVILCEGYSTAATLHEATGATCIIAFNAGNLQHIARQIKGKFTICADNDQWKKKNAGVYYAKKAADQKGVIADIIVPRFEDTSGKPTDFNDLAALQGLDEVKKQLTPQNPLQEACLNITELINMDIPEEKCFLAPWLKVNSISEIFGWRGCGKTWFVLSILDAITKGKSFLGWDCQEPASCLYLDAEMTMRDDQKRAGMLDLGSNRKKPLYLLSNEHLVKSGLQAITLINSNSRQQLKELLINKKIKLWVADNISSLSPGGDENQKQDWDEINQWLMDLRFNGISTILLHHSNKSGSQRGTSAREDNLDAVINLQQPDDYVTEDGARVIVHFEKNRGVDSNNLKLITDMDIKLCQQKNGKLGFNYAEKNTKITQKDIELIRDIDRAKNKAELIEKTKMKQHEINEKIKKYKEHKIFTENMELTEKGIDLVFT